MKAMKRKIVVAIVMVVIFISSSTAIASQGSCSQIDDGPELEVKVEARKLFQEWYLIWLTV